MHDTTNATAIALPFGWIVERHRHAKIQGSTGQDAVESFILRSPDDRAAAFYDIDGENGLVWKLLQAITEGREGEAVGAGPLSSHVREPYALVMDRQYDGAGLSLAVHDGINFTFGDGDCFERDGETLDGYTAQFMTHKQLERLLSAGLHKARRIPAVDIVALALRLTEALRKASPDDPLADEAADMLNNMAGPATLARQATGTA